MLALESGFLINYGRPFVFRLGDEGAPAALSIVDGTWLREVVELDDAFAAVDVAEACSACLDAKEGKASIVGAAVVLANADHMLESSFAYSIAHLVIVCQIRRARKDDPALAGLPAGELELGMSFELEPNILVARGAKPEFPGVCHGKRERAYARLGGVINVDSGKVPRGHAAQIRDDFIHERLLFGGE